jgi:hypothetical protein
VPPLDSGEHRLCSGPLISALPCRPAWSLGSTSDLRRQAQLTAAQPLYLGFSLGIDSQLRQYSLKKVKLRCATKGQTHPVVTQSPGWFAVDLGRPTAFGSSMAWLPGINPHLRVSGFTIEEIPPGLSVNFEFPP